MAGRTPGPLECRVPGSPSVPSGPALPRRHTPRRERLRPAPMCANLPPPGSGTPLVPCGFPRSPRGACPRDGLWVPFLWGRAFMADVLPARVPEAVVPGTMESRRRPECRRPGTLSTRKSRLRPKTGVSCQEAEERWVAPVASVAPLHPAPLFSLVGRAQSRHSIDGE